MKALLSVILMMIATQAFAESRYEAAVRVNAEMKSACSGGATDGCMKAVEAKRAEEKSLLKEVFIDQPEANRQHQQEVIQDEQLRQRVRQRGY